MAADKRRNRGANLSKDSLRKSLIELFTSEDLPLEVLESIHSDLKEARGDSSTNENASPTSSTSCDFQSSVGDLAKFTNDANFVETVCHSIHKRTGTDLYEFLHGKPEMEGCETVQEGDEEDEEEIFDLRGVLNGFRIKTNDEADRGSPSFSHEEETERSGSRSSAASPVTSFAQSGERPRRADPPGMVSSDVVPVSPERPIGSPQRRRIKKKSSSDDNDDLVSVRTKQTPRTTRTRKKKVGVVSDTDATVMANIKTLASSPNSKKMAVKIVKKKRSGEDDSPRRRSTSVSSRKSTGSSARSARSSASVSSRKLSTKKSSGDLSDVSGTDFSEREKEEESLRERKASSKKMGSKSEHRPKDSKSSRKKPLEKLMSNGSAKGYGSSDRSVVSAMERPSSRSSMNRKSSHRKLKSSRHETKRESSRRPLERQDSDECSFAGDDYEESDANLRKRDQEGTDISKEVLECLAKAQRESKGNKEKSNGRYSTSALPSSTKQSTQKKTEGKRDSLRKTCHDKPSRPAPPCRILTKSSSLKDMMSSWADFEVSPDDFDQDAKTVVASGRSPSKKKNRLYHRSNSMTNTSSSNLDVFASKDFGKPSKGNSLENMMRSGGGVKTKQDDDVSIGDFSVNRKWQVNLNSPAKKSRRQLAVQVAPAFTY